jgi:hypothetical protein
MQSWKAIFFAIILVLSAPISNSSFSNLTVAQAEKNQTCPTNQFNAFGHCYVIGIHSIPNPSSGCGHNGRMCASIPYPSGYAMTPVYINGLLTDFQCANLSNCPSGTISHNNACVAIETGQQEPSPFKQIKNGVLSHNVICKAGFVLVEKSSTNSVACVKPTTFSKLISSKWGFDPSMELTVEGLKDAYKVGEQIDFVMKFNELIGDCTEPHVLVKDQTNQTIWESKFIEVPCPPDLTLHHAEGEMKFGNSELGYLRINQTGSYYIHIWFATEITEKINIINP